MWIFDLRTLRFLAVNQATVDLYGYSRQELLKMTVADIRPAEEIPSLMKAIGVARTTGDVQGTWRHRAKSGELLDVEAHWNPIVFRGHRARVAVAVDVRRRLEAERNLKRLHDELERRVAERTTELEAANRELESRMDERRRLSAKLVQVEELERRHLARELHDEIGQALTGLKLTLQTVPRVAADEAREKLEWADRLVDALMKQIRQMSLSLRPAVLDDLGLLPALLWHLDQYTSRTGIRVLFTHAGIEHRLTPDVETAAYRIVQEALTNVARHAGVKDARLWVRRDGEELCVIVEDEGRGIQPPRDGALTSGLSGMRERAQSLGGEFFVETGSFGSRLTAIIPVARS